MEHPYGGRAIITDHFNGVDIIIPAKKNWFAIIFLCVWLCFWTVGEFTAIVSMTGILAGKFPGLFMLVWLIGWTVGGFFALKTLLWNVTGKEVILVGQGELAIDKKGDIFFKRKVYDLNDIKDVRVQEDYSNDDGFFNRRRNSFGDFSSVGTIRFDYGLQTVKFAGGLDEAEAKFILQKLKDKHLLSEKNYSG